MGAEGDRPPAANVLVVRRGRRLDARGTLDVALEDGSETKIDASEPVDLPFGYHTIHMRGGAMPLIVSPGACYLSDSVRGWGWGVQLYSLHSSASWGIGDTKDLAELGRWARSSGAGMLLLNPLHAAAPGQSSPYFPSSRSFRNPIYIDVDAVARELDAEVDRPEGLMESDTVDRPTVYDSKVAALEALWPRGRNSKEFASYRKDAGDALALFATYMTIAEEHGWDTSEWPRELQHPAGSGVESRRVELEERAQFHEWLQWLLDRQLTSVERTIDVIHDLAIGVDPGGADAWLWKDSFAAGVTIGAPPDELAIAGQNWGMPPFDPWKLRAAAYEPFIRTVRAGLSAGAGLRVDHVMGLFRLWWIPEGGDASDGAYVRYPKDDLLNILALESHRARSFVIGEDLGTVEPSVREEMEARNMLSYRVMWFEPSAPKHFPELALACVTNHDLPTVAGLWGGQDIEEQAAIGLETDEEADAILRGRLQERAGVGDDAQIEEVITGAYRALSDAPSRIKIATLEDACAQKRRPNQPGTTDERPNWALRLPLSLEELKDAPLPKRIADAMNG